jgi:hypothetical protein
VPRPKRKKEKKRNQAQRNRGFAYIQTCNKRTRAASKPGRNTCEEGTARVKAVQNTTHAALACEFAPRPKYQGRKQCKLDGTQQSKVDCPEVNGAATKRTKHSTSHLSADGCLSKFSFVSGQWEGFKTSDGGPAK